MSKYKVVKCELKNRSSLLEALTESGIPFETAEVENGLALVGFQGDTRPERCTFVVRRKHISESSNDLGFERQADGS